MKFSIVHLGRIAAAELEIKPFTVFIGKTNTNKTWTAYALYGILRSMTYFMRSGFGSDDKILPSCPFIDAAVERISRTTAKLLADRAQDLTVGTPEGTSPTHALEVTRDDVLNTAGLVGNDITLELTQETLSRILAVEPAIVKESRATLSFDAGRFRTDGKVKSLKFVIDKQTVTVSATLPTGGQVPLNSFSSVSEKLTPESIYSQIVVFVRWLVFAVIGDALAFPAERKAMSALWATLDPAQKGPQVRSLLNVPCLDFMRFLQVARQAPAVQPSPVAKIVGLLERHIMNGRAEFSSTPEARIFSYKSEAGPAVQIHASASLVRALAGFDLYLRQTQSPLFDIMVIDEPEMNAHPEAQIKLVELFAMLANSGFRVIVTTHSPYFIDHLNNLMAGFDLPAEKKTDVARSLKLTDENAFISAEKVSAYLFQEDGHVKDLIVDAAIDAESFADETDYLNGLYSSISHAQEAE